MDQSETFEQILADYLTAAETGTAPPLSELLEQHPDQAAELSEFFTLRRDFAAIVHLPPPLSASWTAAPAFPIAFGEYQLLGELGVGGMGLVFKARHTPTGRVVALKVLRSGRFASADERRRFATEAEACLALDHPGIVPVYAVGETDGQPFFTMRLMPGGSLAEQRATRCATVEAAVRLVAELAVAMDHAHRRGVLHRDLKPSNVLFDEDGRPYLSDFSLAKRLDTVGHDRTRTGVAVGTPAYMAPEQAGDRPDSVTTASDVYGLGGVLYFALTGRPPFDPSQPAAERVPPSRLGPAVPRDLGAVCLTCLAAEPARRYASAAELVADLRRFLAGKPVRARRAGLAERVVRVVRRNPVVVGLMAVAVAGVLTALFFAYQNDSNTRRLNADLTESLDREERQRENLLRANLSIKLKLACDAYAAGLYEDAAENLRHLRPGSGEPDRRGFVWHYLDRQTRAKRAFRRHQGVVWGVTISSDGRTAASVGTDGTARLWDLATGDPLAEWPTGLQPADPQTLSLIALRPDAEQLVVAENVTKDGRPVPVRVFDRTGRLVAERPEPVKHLWAIEWTADGGQVYLAGQDAGDRGTLTAWTPATGAAVALPLAPGRHIRALRRSPDGKSFAAALADRGVPKVADVVVFPPDRPDQAAAAHLDQPFEIDSIDFSPDGSHIAAVTDDAVVFKIDARTMREVWRRQLPSEPNMAWVVWADGGRSLAVAWDNGRMTELTVLDAATGDPRPDRSEARTGVRSLARDPAGRGLVVGSIDGLVRWRAEPVPAFESLVGHTGEVWALAFHPNGRLLASGADDATIRLWDTATRTERAVLRGHESLVMALAFSPDGRELYSGGWDHHVRIWDVETGREKAAWKAHDAQVAALAVCRGGRLLVTDSRDGRAKVWDLATRSLVKTLPGHTRRLHSVAVAPDGARVTLVSAGHTITEWDTAGWEPVRTLTAAQLVNAVSYSPDGAELLYGSWEGSVNVSAAGTGETRLWFHAHQEVFRVLATPDGQCVVTSGGADVRVWDRESGHPLLHFGHPALVLTAALSPDGRVLATGCHDGVVRLWSARD